MSMLATQLEQSAKNQSTGEDFDRGFYLEGYDHGRRTAFRLAAKWLKEEVQRCKDGFEEE